MIFLIGRSDQCHIVLDDVKVSREHAQLCFKNNTWTLQSLSSFGSVLVNGNNITLCELKNGDLITISNYILNLNIQEVAIVTPKEDKKPELDQTKSMANTTQDVDLSNPDEETIIVDNSLAEIQGLSDLNDPVGKNIEASEKTVQGEQEGDSLKPSDDLGHEFDDGPEQSDDEFDTEFDDSSEQPKDNEEVLDDGDFSFSDDDTQEDDPFESSEYADEAFENQENHIDDSSPGGEYPLEELNSEKTQVFNSFSSISLDIFGEYAPYDKYLLDNEETYIGRDPSKCQIILNDPEVSSVHTVIRKNNVFCIVEDLQSVNGTLLNGVRVNKAEVTNNDEFIVGSTTFTVRVISEQIHQEENRLMPVEDKQIIEVEEIVEVESSNQNIDTDSGNNFSESFDEGFSATSAVVPIWKDKKKRIYLIVGLLLVAFVFLDEDFSNTKKSKKGNQKKTGLVINKKNKIKKKVYTQEEEEFLAGSYELAKSHLVSGRYTESLYELDKIFKIAADYKKSKDLRELAKEGLAKIEEVEKRKREESEKRERDAQIKKYIEKAREAVTNRQKNLAQSLFEQILQLDPENYDVPQLKLDLEQWILEQDEIARVKTQQEFDRNIKVEQFNKHKKFYLQKEWYRAILQLEAFLFIKKMDKDLTDEAVTMLTDAREKLANTVSPLLGKARSFKEGQDLKNSYESYKEILIYEPTHTEATNEMVEIRDKLNNRAKKIYRDAIVSESLSLFSDAKEKLQEVKQLSPSDSEYFKKASRKLKNYLE